MLDLNHLERYRENNRLEAKRALGGLPWSLWETYSSFANTQGGLILLGVEEYADRSLHPIDLPDPAAILQDFWRIVNDPHQVSLNILRDDYVQTLRIAGGQIIAIYVPPAAPAQKPVYIGGDPLRGTYRRIGEADILCSPEEVQRMVEEKIHSLR